MVAWSVYRDQLAHLSHGLALWEPDPGGIYDHVTIGDLGYVDKGHFMLVFNILLRGDHPRQTFGVPESFEPLNMGHFPNECSLVLSKGSYCSQTVSERKLEIGAQGPAVPGMASGGGTAYKCTKKKGAMLSIPFNADRQDAIRTKLFETYIIAHCDSWLPFADKRGFPVDRLEDIIIVTGRDLTNSWAMAAFTDTSRDWDLSLSIEAMGGGANLGWSCTNHTQNSVECHDSGLFSETEAQQKTQCLFIRGFRAKRAFPFFKKLKAAAEPQPDDPDNEPESQIELLRVPEEPQYRDPLIGVLDYIAGHFSDGGLAIAHEDDLRMIGGVDVLTADAVENFLREKGTPIQVENGVALLADETEAVPDNEKITFFAQSELEGERIPLVIHPVLMKYLLEIDVDKPTDEDYGLPDEEYFCTAVHPPIRTLVLESDQGYPHNIEARASEKDAEAGVTVKDVLRTISEDIRKPSSLREYIELAPERQQEVSIAFDQRARTEEEREGGPLRVDFFCGRNRLQIFPRDSAAPIEEDMQRLASQQLEPKRFSDAPNVAGPSSLPTDS